MINQGKDRPLYLVEFVRALESKNSLARGRQIQAALEALGLEAAVQEYHCPQIKNIIVDFSPSSKEKRLLFTAHYDVVKGSPGANDNASGVSVLLGLCYQLKHIRAPVRIVFFDREEAWLRTPILRLGLLGSLYYAWRANVQTIAAVYNLELCGSGDCLGIWPIRGKETSLPAFRQVTRAAARLALPFKAAHIPWVFFSSDYLSFRLRGIPNALTLSLLPTSQTLALEKSLAGLSLWKLLVPRRPTLPEPLCFIHSNEDISSRLNEKSLRLMLSLLLELIQSYRPQAIRFNLQD